jgi:hypothetical protein
MLLAMSGCTTYYKVTDLNDGTTYYTTKIRKMESGAISFKDGHSGDEVTLPSSKIAEVDKKEYKSGTQAEK